MKYYLGIDLGGTNIVAGVVSETFEILSKESAKTRAERGADAVIAEMVEVCRRAVKQAGLTMEQLEWAGVGSPGTANKETGQIEYSNNLQWYNVPLVEKLEAGLGIRVYIENDANAAAYGEYLAGAGKGCTSLVAITLGTGVGGGVIIDGKILTGSNFAGAELGHTVIEVDGRPCTCGRLGCFEAYASATGLINMTRESMEAHPDSKMWELCGGEIGRASGRTSFDGMRAGDAAAKAVVDQYIKYLSVGIANMINIFQPQILCIGGGISREGDTLIAPLTRLVNENNYVRDPAKRTKIIPAALFNDAGLIGAAMLGLEADGK